MIGTTELVLLSGLALLLFGGKKLPEMMRGLGQGVKEFKKGMKDSPSTERKKDNDTQSHKEIEEKHLNCNPKEKSELIDDGGTKE